MEMGRTKSWFLDKISKIDKPLAKLANRKSRSKLIKSEMKRVITKDTKENQYYYGTFENLYLKVLDNVEQKFSICGVVTPFRVKDSFQGSPKTIGKIDIYIMIHNSNKITVMKQQRK